jgi:hypothetical protein
VANPVKPGQHQQVKEFINIGEERLAIPHKIYFNLDLVPVKPTEKLEVQIR